jgi:hypothetical protein
MLGALGAMAPTRRQDFSKIVMRAMICGNVACFLTACISGEKFVFVDHGVLYVVTCPFVLSPLYCLSFFDLRDFIIFVMLNVSLISFSFKLLVVLRCWFYWDYGRYIGRHGTYTSGRFI